jgi:signal transduction histidine kinase
MQPSQREFILVGTYNGVNAVSPYAISALHADGAPLMCTHMIESFGDLYFINDNILFKGYLDKDDPYIIHISKRVNLPSKALFLASDSKGNISIATDGGMYAWDGIRATRLLLPNEHFHCVMIDEHDQLWAGSFSNQLRLFTPDPITGMYKENDSAKKLISAYPDLKQIRSIIRSGPGTVFVGTRYNGLYRIAYNVSGIDTITAYGLPDGLQSKSIWGLSIDATGKLWIATAKGLQSMDLSSFEIHDHSQANDIHHAAHVFVDRADQVWVASHPGISQLHRQDSEAIPFETSLTALHVNGKLIGWQANEGVPAYSHTQNQFSFTFSSPTYRNEQAVSYQYRLQRNGKGDWSLPTAGHTAHYPALLPGEYTFAVRAQNMDGVWSSREATYVFSIAPPFWRTPGFIVAAIALLGLALYGIYRYRVQQILKVQQIRNNISKDLHDDIGASLSNIHILTSLAQRNIHMPAQAMHYLDQAGDDIQRISESLSDIVWNINPQHDDLEPLLSRMKRYAADMLEGNQIEAQISFPEVAQGTHIAMEQRRDFLLIFKEAIHNLIRHSKATMAWIQVTNQQDALSLVIRDNGIGFDHASRPEGNGLVNMRLRAEQMHAQLSISSRPGEGTTIRLDMKR